MTINSLINDCCTYNKCIRFRKGLSPIPLFFPETYSVIVKLNITSNMQETLQLKSLPVSPFVCLFPHKSRHVVDSFLRERESGLGKLTDVCHGKYFMIGARTSRHNNSVLWLVGTPRGGKKKVS